MCYATYYSFVSRLISIFFCWGSFIGPGMHLALPCQQVLSDVLPQRHTQASACMYTHGCTQTQYRAHKTNAHRAVGARGKGGNYSGGPKLENESDFLKVPRPYVPQFHTLSKCPAFPESHILMELLQKHTKCPSFTCGLIMST